MDQDGLIRRALRLGCPSLLMSEFLAVHRKNISASWSSLPASFSSFFGIHPPSLHFVLNFQSSHISVPSGILRVKFKNLNHVSHPYRVSLYSNESCTICRRWKYVFKHLICARQSPWSWGLPDWGGNQLSQHQMQYATLSSYELRFSEAAWRRDGLDSSGE